MSFRSKERSPSFLGWLDSDEESSESSENEVEAGDQEFFEGVMSENLENRNNGLIQSKIKDELTKIFTQGKEENEDIEIEQQEKIDEMIALISDQEQSFGKMIDVAQFLLKRTKDLAKCNSKKDNKYDKMRSKL